jgi:predicted amidohydrolase YtcJ
MRADPHAFGEGWSAAEAWDLYAQLQAEGDLPLRVELTTSSDEEGRPPPGDHPTAALLRCGRAKIFGDGSLGAETAALRSDYIHELSPTSGANRGQMIFGPAELAQRVRGAAVEGYRLEVHAIGDAAAEAVLDAFEAELGPPPPAAAATAGAAADAVPDTDADTGASATGARADAGADVSVPLSSRARPVLTHCQVLGDDLIARMAVLGVVANIQPSFVPTDARFVSQRLAASVHRTSYAWRSLLAAGVWCAGGSDAPVELPWPLLGMHDAMARAARPEGGGAAERSAAPAACDIFLPEERLDSLFEQVEAVTTAPGRPGFRAGPGRAYLLTTHRSLLGHSRTSRGIVHPASQRSGAQRRVSRRVSHLKPTCCRLPFAAALWLYTLGGAYAIGERRRRSTKAVTMRTPGCNHMRTPGGCHHMQSWL